MRKATAVVTVWMLAAAGVLMLGVALARPAAARPIGLGQPVVSMDQARRASAPGVFAVLVMTPTAFGIAPSLSQLANAEAKLEGSGVERALPLLRLQRPSPATKTPGPAETDRVVQDRAGALAMPAPIANFDGLNNLDDIYPPDTNGDIGYDPATGKRYYFQWINLHLKAWDVTNPAAPTVVVSATAGNQLWVAAVPGSECATSNDGDTMTLFDEQAHRWLISQFALGPANSGPFHQCVAVSQTADPSGAWYVYDYTYRNGVNWFNDYPHFGVWPDAVYGAYYMTVHQFDNAGVNYLGEAVGALDRAKLLAGDPSPQLLLYDLNGVNHNFFGMLAADLDGAPPPAGTPGYFFEVDDSSFIPPTDALRIWEFRPDWTTPANSTFGVNGTPNVTLTVASFNLLSCAVNGQLCIPQPGTAQQLDALGDRLMHRAALRNFGGYLSVLLNHTVDAGAGRAGVRWYEVRQTGGAWSIYQQGTYAPNDGLQRWMGSIAQDAQGNIALGYSASSTGTFPSILYAGRVPGDPLGTLPQAETILQAGGGSQTGSKGRWGDYSMMGVDPEDQCTFWYTNEYLPVTSAIGWQTRIGSFEFSGCTSSGGTLQGIVHDADLNQPLAGATVEVRSPLVLSSTITNGSGQYVVTNLTSGTYAATASASGYSPVTIDNITVNSGTTTTQDISLPHNYCPPGTTSQTLYRNNFEAGTSGWAHSGISDTWSLWTSRTHSLLLAWHADDVATVSDQILTSPPLTIPATAISSTFSFWNYQAIEHQSTGSCYDGGLLEISNTMSMTWKQITSGLLTDPYNGPINSNFFNPLGGRLAWCGDPQDWLNSIVDLSPYRGQTVQLRFRLGTDNSNIGAREGWTIDDVALQVCAHEVYLPLVRK